MPQNLGNLLRAQGIGQPIPKPKQTGPVVAPLRPSMAERLILARIRREIQQEKTNGQSEMSDGTSLPFEQPNSYET